MIEFSSKHQKIERKDQSFWSEGCCFWQSQKNNFGNKKTLPVSKECFLFESRWRDSNPRPADYKSAALAS
jgi:hypothetical protein